MIRTLFDFQAFQMQTHGGVSRCFAELIHCLPDDVEAVVGASILNISTKRHSRARYYTEL